MHCIVICISICIVMKIITFNFLSNFVVSYTNFSTNCANLYKVAKSTNVQIYKYTNTPTKQYKNVRLIKQIVKFKFKYKPNTITFHFSYQLYHSTSTSQIKINNSSITQWDYDKVKKYWKNTTKLERTMNKIYSS